MNIKNVRKRKKILERLVKKDQNDYCALIYFLIRNGTLDYTISKMDNIRTIPNTTCIVKKGYLSSEEQFLDVLYHVINVINIDFGFVRKKTSVIELILKNPKATNLLLCKNYIGDNSFIPFYQFNIKKVCIYSFVDNLKFIEKTKKIINFFAKKGINIDSINLNKKEDVNKLYEILKLICLCNYSEYALFYIFNNQQNIRMRSMVTIQIESLIKHTEKMEKEASKFLNNLY